MNDRRDGLKIRERLERLEHQTLSPLAMKSDASRGRARPEPPCHVRPAFMRDRDRIIHVKAFRRLKHKTQVFLAPQGDHYRTRLTHTIEVSQIARTIARALALNEDLTEAIALGHDLGHTPFGHAGEQALDEVHPGGFHHWEQSLRVVDVLAQDGRGLNLCWEVRDGILKHSKGKVAPIIGGEPADLPATMEGRVVRVADVVAYANHDLQDAILAGLIGPADVPADCVAVLGQTTSVRIHNLVSDIIEQSARANDGRVLMSDPVLAATEWLRDWLFEAVYFNDRVQLEFKKSSKLIHELYHFFVDQPDELFRRAGKNAPADSHDQAVCDYIASMSDSFALQLYQELFMPRPWSY